MIVLDLSCANLHRFEGWFASNDDYASQSARRLVSCPICGSQEIRKLPSSPHLRRSGEESDVAATKAVADSAEQYSMLQIAATMLQQILRESEDVGDLFAEEARRIHHNEAPARNIRGVATTEAAKELLEEGILVVPLPLLSKGDMH